MSRKTPLGFSAFCLIFAALLVTTLAQPSPVLTIGDPGISQVGALRPGGLGLPGERLDWTITVTNVTDVAASAVTVTDTVPSELRIDSVSPAKGIYTVSGQTVTVAFGDMALGEAITIRLVTTVLRSPVSGLATNTATVTGLGHPRSATGTVSLVSGLPATGYHK